MAEQATTGGPPAPTGEAADGVSFVLDGRAASARKGEMLISAAERAGTYIPRFCYHPRMDPVGMCRMCLVEVSGPRGATLQPACFIPATEGMEVVTTSAKVKKAQDGVLEFLLANHPLDCPVCDKGGECPLQDQALAYGPGESRFVEEKRHFEKPIAISELVLLDRERCIQCARCTRFADEIAGEAQIDFAGRGEKVEVATFPTEPFSSYFSGNTVQICPVGALTATPYRFAARPWDLDQVESTCTTCSLGCRVAVQSSADRVTRLLGIDSEPVNHGWLCDKGRFVFESSNGQSLDGQPAGDTPSGTDAVHTPGARVTEPMVRRDGVLTAVGWSEALAAAAEAVTAARDAAGPTGVAVLGGARLTNEGAYAWAKLVKGVIGTDSVDAQMGDGLPADLVLALPRATIAEACAAKALVLLTGDLREELPVLYLRLRRAVTRGTTALVEIVQRPSALTRLADVSVPVRPGDAPAVVRALTGDRSGEADLAAHPEGAAAADGQLEAARQVLAGAGINERGDGVVVVVGRPSLAEHEGIPAEAAAILARAWPGATFLPALRRGNVHGALDMGLAPGVLPGRIGLDAGREHLAAHWDAVPAAPGLDATAILRSLADGGRDGDVRTLVLLGADPLGDFPDHQLAERAIRSAGTVVAVAGHWTESVAHADVVLPCAVAHERPGTTTNVEGRVSRVGQKLVAPGSAWADWVIAAELAVALGSDLGVVSLVDVWEEIGRTAPAYRGLTLGALETAAARDGLLAPVGGRGGRTEAAALPNDPIAVPGIESVERQGAPPRVGRTEPPVAAVDLATPGRDAEPGATTDGVTDPVDAATRPTGMALPAPTAPHVPPADSYSLRLVASRRLYDSGVSVQGSPSLVSVVDPMVAAANPYDLDRLGVSSGDLVRVRSGRGSLVMRAEPDAGVPKGVVAIPFNVPGSAAGQANAAAALIDSNDAVTDVRLETV